MKIKNLRSKIIKIKVFTRSFWFDFLLDIGSVSCEHADEQSDQWSDQQVASPGERQCADHLVRAHQRLREKYARDGIRRRADLHLPAERQRIVSRADRQETVGGLFRTAVRRCNREQECAAHADQGHGHKRQSSASGKYKGIPGLVILIIFFFTRDSCFLKKKNLDQIATCTELTQ